MKTVTALVRTVLLLGVSGCSGTSITNVSPASGGTTVAAGGSSATGSTNQSSPGGHPSSGGMSASGGTSGNTVAGGMSGSSAVQTRVTGGGPSSGGTNASGGTSAGANTAATNAPTGGISATGGTSAAATSGASTGGTITATGGARTGGTSAATGGTSTGGTSTGGTIAASGGTSAATGGMSTGGMSTGGTSAATGGMSTGGMSTGGTSAAIGGASTGGTSAATTGLLANCSLLLHMDEASWSSTLGEVQDVSGAGNNGTAMVDATTGATAKFGRAGLFGGEGYVSVTSSDSLHAMGAFSVVAWIYPTFLDGTTRSPGIVAKRWAWNDSSEFALYLGVENRLWVDIMTEDNRFSSATVFHMAQWYHVAVVFDGSLSAEKRVSVYVDGQLDTTATESSSVVVPFDSPIEVGRLRDGGQGFIGSIDEVALWQRALSAAEVLSIYERTSPL